LAQDARGEAAGYLRWGVVVWRQGDYYAARTQLDRALVLAQETGLRQVEADSLRNLGYVSIVQGAYDGGRA
jgi:hypothetical protein